MYHSDQSEYYNRKHCCGHKGGIWYSTKWNIRTGRECKQPDHTRVDAETNAGGRAVEPSKCNPCFLNLTVHSGFENRNNSGPLSKKSEKSPDGGGQARTHRTSQFRPVQPAPPVCTTHARTNCARRASVSCVVHARQVARLVSSRRAARATEPPIARICGVR